MTRRPSRPSPRAGRGGEATPSTSSRRRSRAPSSRRRPRRTTTTTTTTYPRSHHRSSLRHAPQPHAQWSSSSVSTALLPSAPASPPHRSRAAMTCVARQANAASTPSPVLADTANHATKLLLTQNKSIADASSVTGGRRPLLWVAGLLASSSGAASDSDSRTSALVATKTTGSPSPERKVTSASNSDLRRATRRSASSVAAAPSKTMSAPDARWHFSAR
mmetsp:Transcript_9631/g.39260  ORF Transcript_9631/g.39260 Transcript_9631/m.39260 type:complete len:219 (+) Transcript_9631:822-1478(+)